MRKELTSKQVTERRLASYGMPAATEIKAMTKFKYNYRYGVKKKTAIQQIILSAVIIIGSLAGMASKNDDIARSAKLIFGFGLMVVFFIIVRYVGIVVDKFLFPKKY